MYDSAMAEFSMSIGDAAPPWSVVLSDASGSPDMAGATVEFFARPPGLPVELQYAVDVTDPVGRIVTNDWSGGKPSLGGLGIPVDYRVQWVVTYADGSQE